MRQRVLLASALLHNPALLVLDEPFSGLDVNAGLLFQALLPLLASEGRMILFSTHRFDMVEKLCSRVVMLSAGRIVAEERVENFARGGAQSLEDVFVRVTSQPDYLAGGATDSGHYCHHMNVRADTPFRLLTRHFFNALFDLGFLSESQTQLAGAAHRRHRRRAAGVRVHPGARHDVPVRGALRLAERRRLNEQTFLTDHVFLIAVPMWIVAFVAVLVGPSLLPDGTDFRVLGAMPVTRPVVFGAKLFALVLFIGLFVAASEAALLPMFTVTTISPHREQVYFAPLAALSRYRRPWCTVRCADSDGGSGAASAARAATDSADGVCSDWQPDAVRAGRRCAAGRPRAVICPGVRVGLTMDLRVSAGVVRRARAVAHRRITVRVACARRGRSALLVSGTIAAPRTWAWATGTSIA